ncbi:MAG TPA: ABC transporter ATP-binding protein [Mycobacteriales bacterium]|nr:ABC transporter ATP-binding protein [Mycobacteriales bacterium]
MNPLRRGTRPLVALGVLAGIAGLQSYGVSMLTPQIATSLDVTALSLLSVRVPALAVDLLLPLAVPLVTDRRRLAVRVWAARGCALAAALMLVLTGEVRSSWALVGVLAAGSVFAAPGRVWQRSMAVTEAGAGLRIRTLGVVQLGGLLAQVALPLGLLVAAASWHRALAVSGLVAVAVVVVAALLLRPTGADAVTPAAHGDAQSWGELGRAWRATPSLVGAGVALGAAGLMVMPYDMVLAIYLRQHFHLGLRGVSAVFLAIAATALVGVAVSASYGDKLLTRRPAWLASASAVALAVASALLVVGPLLANRIAMVVVIALGAAIANALVPVLIGLGIVVVPGRQRSAVLAAAASLLATASLIGVVVAVCVADRYGARYALVALAGIGVPVAAWWRFAAAEVESDRRHADLSGQRADVQPEGAAGPGPTRLLTCQGVDFSYGSLQVLFGVDAHVEDGEIVGLLGTNGAGKSTLLRVISGLGTPQRGSVTFAGRDITYLDAEARVRLGITQVPGGKAVFRSMNVIENLQSFGYTLGRDRRAVDEAVERCLDAFPRLRERKTSAAAMLSGGEQQMVALSKALMLRPRILLIDELSLGLAPVIVNRLLEMVRRINADGTAVVIVEQSVTTALSLVHRAYFMEKGEVRFDGPAADLVDRHDLLRAVFLEGAAKGVLT